MYQFFDDMNSIKNLGPNKIKINSFSTNVSITDKPGSWFLHKRNICRKLINENSYQNILIYCIGYVTPNSVKSLFLIINKINGYIKERNGNKYLRKRLKNLLD